MVFPSMTICHFQGWKDVETMKKVNMSNFHLTGRNIELWPRYLLVRQSAICFSVMYLYHFDFWYHWGKHQISIERSFWQLVQLLWSYCIIIWLWLAETFNARCCNDLKLVITENLALPLEVSYQQIYQLVSVTNFAEYWA